MKNNLYQRVQRRLTLVFLLCTVLVTFVLLLIIAFIYYRSSFLASIGALKESDFLYFYRYHTWEINMFIFAGSYIFMLFLFLRFFFKTMDVLVMFMQGKEIASYPLFLRYMPEFQEALRKIEQMKEKREESRKLSIQETEHKNELLMYLAHDLKTPLTSLIGYINHVLDHKLEQQEEKKAILIASEKAKRLDTLIDEFSEMLRYDDRVEHLENGEIDVSILLKQQLTGFYPLMEQKHMTLQENIEEHLLVYGDYDKLQRVFDNLLKNALNYSVPFSMISICGKQQKENICITLSNQSEGLKQDSIKHLFDKFYRAGSARTSSSGGAGLGLAIAKEIITLHKGIIEASIKDNMITFTILLPKKEEERL